MMRDLSCILLSTTNTIQDAIGNETNVKSERIIPIIKNEEIYSAEYYSANQVGMKPTLRIKISTLNYEGEKELIYMGSKYSIIRTQETSADEIVLICERKIKDV